jgi:hypothetical protein
MSIEVLDASQDEVDFAAAIASGRGVSFFNLGNNTWHSAKYGADYWETERQGDIFSWTNPSDGRYWSTHCRSLLT